MTTAQVVERSVTVTNSSFQNYTHPDDHTRQTMYAIRAYLLPCNHHEACQETKWMIRDRAPPTKSKQICLSMEAPLNLETSCMVRDSKWAATHDSTLFRPEVRPYFPPVLTLVFDTDCFLQC